MKAVRIEVYATRARTTPWTWRMVNARNGKIQANAAETFDSPGNAKRAGRRMGDMLGCEVRFYTDDKKFDVLQEHSVPWPVPAKPVVVKAPPGFFNKP